MSPNDFFSPLEGQSLLIPGQDERFRGQCPQPVGLYVQALGLTFPAYIDAYLYWDKGIPGYTKVQVGNPIKEGDIIVWRADFPPSLGSGHMDVAAQDGTLANFVAWDSNWYPPLKLAKLSHLGNNNNYIAGYLRRQGADMVVSQSVAEKIVTYFYRLGTGNYPTPGQAEYWVPRVRDVPTGIDELGTALLAAQVPPTPSDYVAYTGEQLFVKKT